MIHKLRYPSRDHVIIDGQQFQNHFSDSNSLGNGSKSFASGTLNAPAFLTCLPNNTQQNPFRSYLSNIWEWSKLKKPQRNQIKLMGNWNIIWKTNEAISDTKSNFREKMSTKHQQSARGKRGMLPIITYFNRTVKVLMEALSGVETKHLHLRVKRWSKNN